jgi:hypothetical protein
MLNFKCNQRKVLRPQKIFLAAREWQQSCVSRRQSECRSYACKRLKLWQIQIKHKGCKTEYFLDVLKGPSAGSAKRGEALRFVIQSSGDLHQPLHDEDDGDKGGNTRHVIFDGKPDNLDWIWDTGLAGTHQPEPA